MILMDCCISAGDPGIGLRDPLMLLRRPARINVPGAARQRSIGRDLRFAPAVELTDPFERNDAEAFTESELPTTIEGRRAKVDIAIGLNSAFDGAAECSRAIEGTERDRRQKRRDGGGSLADERRLDRSVAALFRRQCDTADTESGNSQSNDKKLGHETPPINIHLDRTGPF